jgi:Rrf2 family iron-sulfur cluster assembly transcriptional regulator
MRLTTKGRFAVTAMVDLAMRGGKAPVTLAAISERQKISLSYLEQLFGKLRRNKIVESVRGPGGGYYLARPGSKISIAEIVIAVDEPLDATKCGGKGNCNGDNNPCLTHELWMGLNESILDYLQAVSLQQMVDDSQAKRTSRMPVVTLKKSNKAERVAS